MKKLIILLLFIPLIQPIMAQDTPVLSKVSDLEQKIDALVKQYQDLDLFAGVVLVSERGTPFYHKAFGYADRENKRKNTIDTKFDIGSMNKAFTKVVVLQLVKEGKLSFDDPLGKYLDGFDADIARKVTVGQLLDHTSGFGDYHDPTYFDRSYEEKDMHQLLPLFRKLPLMFEPGTEQAYSNAGYVLLGLIIEKATGKDYFEVVRERAVDKLGLKNTYLTEKYRTPERAIGYTRTMRGELEANDYFQDPPKPDGGFYSTTLDMLRFFRAYHYGEELWDEATRSLDPMFTFLQEHKDSGGAIPHAGGFSGANTVHYEILRDQVSIDVFANRDELVAEDVGTGILAIIRGKEPEKPAQPAHLLIYRSYRDKGIDYVRDHFEELSTNWHPADPKDMILNMIGYNLMYSDDPAEVDQAIEVLTLNTELFPEVANVWDSLGEAWLRKGDKTKALRYYKKALAIRPDLPSALEAVKGLED
ncbi:MAG: serine hydrolase [Saprospiraceae bacterium]|nr:serine hydrolase [Lewinella sp.]